MPRAVVVGGGLSGLSLAYRLERLRPDLEVVVLERDNRVGGKVVTTEQDGFRVEGGPNGFLDNKPAMTSLCQELGLGERLVAASAVSARNRFLFLRHRLRKLPDSLLSFLSSDALSWRSKLALATERYRRNRPAAPDESIDAFARRRAGDEVAETLGDAFVTGIYAGDPSLLSLRSTFPRLADLENRYGSVTGGMAAERKQRRREGAAAGRRPGMWSFREGLGFLTETLRQRLRTPPRTGCAAHRVMPAADGWHVECDSAVVTADVVALTCPAFAQAELVAAVDPELAGELQAIPYNRVVVVALGYRTAEVPHALDGFGYLTPQRERRDVLGVQWCSSTFAGRAPPGLVLLRALCGGWHRAEMVDWDEARLLQAVREELRLTLGIQAAPVFQRIVRWPQAIPQYLVGHEERLARIERRVARHPGLYLGGNAFRGVAMNDCVEQANLLAARIVQERPAPLGTPAPA